MSKRTASSTSFGASNEPSAKRSASLIDAYFPSKTGPAKPPQPIVASDPITDRQSTFIAHAAPCSNHVQAQTLQKYVRNLRTTTHPVECSHEILAWRTLTLKPGKTGLDSDDDFKITIDGDDDGEKGGSTIIKEVLTREGGIDVAIVISRLYGGIMLGPARFTHMRQCASQALARLIAAQRLSTLLSRLKELDEEIRSHSAPTKSSPATPSQKSNYAALDIAKAERLVTAREKRLDLLRKKQREEEEELWRQVEEGQDDPNPVEGVPGEEERDEIQHDASGDKDPNSREGEPLSVRNVPGQAVE